MRCYTQFPLTMDFFLSDITRTKFCTPKDDIQKVNNTDYTHDKSIS